MSKTPILPTPTPQVRQQDLPFPHHPSFQSTPLPTALTDGWEGGSRDTSSGSYLHDPHDATEQNLVSTQHMLSPAANLWSLGGNGNFSYPSQRQAPNRQPANEALLSPAAEKRASGPALQRRAGLPPASAFDHPAAKKVNPFLPEHWMARGGSPPVRYSFTWPSLLQG